jgi:hypothetical protein
MEPPDKSLLRLAMRIHTLLTAPVPPTRFLELPTATWNRAEKLIQRIRRAELSGLPLAADKLRQELRYKLSSLASSIHEIQQSLFTTREIAYAATASDVFRDLQSLVSQFDSVSFDAQGRFLSVVTEPITLEERYLGPFEIRLELRRPLRTSNYRIIARDPQPPPCQSDVTHPHVRSEVLCEGEGHAAIRQALAEGRLLDFFEIVERVLGTYNAESPFVELGLWDGEDCSDCGETTRPENRYECQRCESLTCIDCAATCSVCDCTFCAHCICKCFVCLQAYCGDCLRSCDSCRRDVCTNCLTTEERCSECHEEESNLDDETAIVAVHSAGVGQATVSP